MKVTVEEQKPTPPPKKVVIELDENEAEMLRSILSGGVDWINSGELGKFAETLHDKMRGVPDRWTTNDNLPTWEKR